MSEAVLTDRPRIPYRVKFAATLVLLILVEEATPFVPMFGIIFLIGLFVPRLNLWISRHLLAYYDAGRGTAYANRLPSAAALRAARSVPSPEPTLR